MASSSQHQPEETKLEHPAPILLDVEDRLRISSDLQNEIQTVHHGFSFRVEQQAMILLAEPGEFKDGGTLSEDRSPMTLKRRLTRGSPFAKHYFLYSDPDNLTKNKFFWEHAFPKAPIPQPPLTVERVHEEDWGLIRQSMYYNQRFRTSPELESIPHSDSELEEAKCRQRDENACQLLPKGTLHAGVPKVFWLIPRGWNDTVDNNNTTGILYPSGTTLSSVDLLDDDIISARKLGKTHEQWNMFCVSPTIFQCLTLGLCGLKYQMIERLGHKGGGKVNVVCQFYWMPQMTGRFNKPSDASDVRAIAKEFNRHVDQKCPRPAIFPARVPAPVSGATIKLEREKEDYKKTVLAVKVHWACVLYNALCGGAGYPHFLTGMDQSDGSLKPRDEYFKEFLIQKDRERLVERLEQGLGFELGPQTTLSEGETDDEVGPSLAGPGSYHNK